MRIAAPAVAAALALTAAPAALAATLHVPSQDYPTIQSAVDAAVEGDVVLVGPGSYDEAVSMVGRTGITIRGQGKPLLAPSATPVLYLQDSTDITVSGLGLRSPGGTGVGAYSCTNLRLDRLVITSPTGTGISLGDASGAVVTRCDVSDATSYGLDDQSSAELVIEKCRFERCDTGMRLSDSAAQGSDGAVVSKNRFTDCPQAIAGGGFALVVVKNRIDGATAGGIFLGTAVPGGNATVSKNRIAISGGYGIVSNFPGGTVEKNVVVGGGIQCLGGGYTVDRNTVGGETSSGILVDGSGNTITRNHVRGGTGIGIETDGASAVLDRNVVSGLPDIGIFVRGAATIVEHNRVTGGESVGIEVESTGCILTRNTAMGNALLDLADENAEGVNSYDSNHFGTVGFNFTP